MELKNLKQPKNTATGIAEKLLLAPVSWFTHIRAPQAPFTDPGDSVTIWQNHLFKFGKGFIEILLAPEKNQLNGTTIGDLGFQKMDQVLEIFIPGSYAEVHEFAKNIINKPLIALAIDAECSERLFYQLGCDCVYAYMKMDFTTGTTRDGVKGYKGTVNYLGSIQLYKGSIQLEGSPATSLSSLFLAAIAIERITGDFDALETMYNNAQSISITDIYNLLVVQADESIVSIGFANNEGEEVEDYLVPVDLSSEAAFIESVYDWLLLNGDEQYVEVDGDELKFYDENASAGYIGIAVPQNILGDDDIVLEIDDDTLMFTE